MALNIATEGGDFDPYVKFNAKAGRWYIKEGEMEVEVDKPVFVADFENIQTGWLLFLEGQAPSKVWDDNLQTPAEKPGDNHKRGFQVRLFSEKQFKGVVELASSSMHLCNAINDLYMQYEDGLASNAGKLPVVQYTDSTPMKDKHGTNYKPNFVIEKWVDRPSAFDASSEDQVEETASSEDVSEF